MAINPSTQYPGKVDTSDPTGYPYGKAQNVTVPGDGTGTPWEQALVNDLFGFSQALMSETGTVPSGTPDKVGASQLLDAVLGLKRKNYIVNPSMAISQENGDGPNVVPSTAFYVADEWFAQNDTGTGTLTSEIGALNGLKSIKITATSAVTDLTAGKKATAGMTNLEAKNLAGLNGKTVSLSFDVRTNWAGKLSVAFRAGGANRSYVTDIDVVSGVQRVYKTIELESNTVDPDVNDLGLFIMIGRNNEGTQQTATVDQWQDGFFTTSTVSTQWTKTSGNYVEITAVKLEEGSVPSAFEPNSYAYDLAQCQRYFERLAGSGREFLAAGHADSSTLGEFLLRYQQKRDAPVISGDATKWEIARQTGASPVLASFTTSLAQINSVRLNVTTDATLSPGEGLLLLSGLTQPYYIDINARL